ncbi:MAG: ferrous iron transport protein B [Ignavibacteriales bacterium]|nr:ferrous iron transport protein B [Ignavibacteriales bacterium]
MTDSGEENRKKHVEKHIHFDSSFIEKENRKGSIVLAGNPNVGKSLIFNELSGMNVEVSNYPGTTVEVIKGNYRVYNVYDTPGIYGVSSFNDEERVARDVILNADIIINVVDGVHLERDLFLTQQLIDMGKRLVVLVNFMDEVKRHQIEIDLQRLSKFLGVPVIPIIAIEKIGFDRLDEAIAEACEGTQREETHTILHSMLKMVGTQAEALLIMEGDEYISQKHAVEPGNHRDEIYIERRNRVNYIISQIIKDVSTKKRFTDLLSRWTIRPITGIPIFIFTLYLSYLFVGKFVAQDVVSFTEVQIGHNHWEPWIRSLITEYIPAASWWNNILVGDFGIITMTTTYLLFLLLPLVIAFYASLSLMEDSGYLPRLATMVDSTLNKIGLNGRAIIPLILGFGCVTSATITTRLLSSEREKTIATALLQFAIPCSAQIAVIAALLAGAGFLPMLVYTITILSVLIAIGTILNKTLKGESTPLLLDLPPMRLPRINNVMRKTMFRSYNFMKEASGWFFVGALAVGLAQSTGVLEFLTRGLKPLTTGWLQLPAEAATAFVMGVVRRDFGAAGLYHLSLSPMQITVALVTITLFVPCIASLMVMMKERGLKEGFIIWIGTWIVAFAIGGIVSHIVL